MKRIFDKNIALILLLCLATSCVYETETGPGSSEGTLPVKLNLRLPSDMKGGTNTRSIDVEDESSISSVELLAFINDGGGEYRYLYSAPIESTYDNNGQVEIVATAQGYNSQQIFMVLVNTPSGTSSGIVRNMSLAASRQQLLVTEANEWNATSSVNYKPLPMYTETSPAMITAGASLGEYDLVRMIARIDVQIKAGVSNFEIVEAHLFNRRTSGQMAFPFDATTWDSSNKCVKKTTYPSATIPGEYKPSYYDSPGYASTPYKADVTDDSRGEILRSIYTFESKGVTEEDRLEATAVIVGGKYNGSNDVTYYRVDIKTDATPAGYISQDILRNHCYQIEIQSVSGAGYPTPEDAFIGAKPIEFTVKVIDWEAETRFPLGLKIQPSANCYLVAPGETFGIPVFGQVQRAMDAGDLTNDWIDNDMDLKAHFLWSDNSEVNGVVNTSKLRVIKSSSSQSTTMLVETGNKTGNAVVAVYNDVNGNGVYDGMDEIKWSWHIWVTDYDPDKQINGTTHVYAGDAFTSGIYVGKRMMDRNLGATWTAADGANIGATMTTASPALTAEKAAKAYGLMYQWGRKDPFTPANGTVTSTPSGAGIVTIYNASGDELIENGASGTGVKLVPVSASTANNLPNAVRNPLTFYFNASPPYDWYNNTGAKNDNLWCENGATSTAGSKTAYDPCPPGWRVPLGGAAATNNPWAGFGNGVANSTAQGTNAIFSWYINGANLGASNATTNNATAGRYYTGNGANAWYPATGRRNHISGEFITVGSYGYNWSAATTGNNGYYLYIYSTNVMPAYNSFRAFGYTVRCVQDDSYNPTPAGPTLTTDADGAYFPALAEPQTITVTSNTRWIANIKRGSNVVTMGEASALGQPLINTTSGFNGGSENGYISDGTANTNTVKTFTITPMDYIDDYKEAEGDLTIIFRDADTGAILNEITLTVGSGELQPDANNCYVVKPMGQGGRPILIKINAQVSRAASVLGASWLTEEMLTATSGANLLEPVFVWTDTRGATSGLGRAKDAAVSYVRVIPKRSASDAYLFIIPGTAEGNAVVGIKNGSDIKWSWHIWVNKDKDTILAGDFSTGLTPAQNWMDRNLGALNNNQNSTSAYGLTYYWGRKDPQPSTYPNIAYNETNGDATMGTAMGSSNLAAASVRLPLGWTDSWRGTNVTTTYTSGDNSWNNGGKTPFDPCPVGWKVPANNVWGTTSNWSAWITTGGGRIFTTTGQYYPPAGYRGLTKGDGIHLPGLDGCYWSHIHGGTAMSYYLEVYSSQVYAGTQTYARKTAFSVRCYKENP